ncbi:MAG: FtsX-like permease family protein [Oscillospiraceae bacterium]|nr:FtsX-like permease family protein [Oscillospiraceae bacterium]
MSKSFYPRLAAQNCIKNGKFYFPYLLTIICTAAGFYINLAISVTKADSELSRYSYLSAYMAAGTIILGVFSLIFLIYTNSFLMKRRSKELGLYNVLGMGKRNIGVVLSYETLYTWLIGTGLGILLGMLLQKFMTLLAQKLMRVNVVYQYYISAKAIGITALFFGGVLLLTLLVNLRRVHVQKPVELLRGGSVGEREPRTRWIIALVGVLTLFGGYYIAVTTSDAFSAVAMYFVAVLLVIIGTYCLFTAVSIAVLKALRKNKRFYYKTGNFIGVSGMLHRMKRNAVGLANICILSTMVLVMISGTLSLYLGTEDSLNSRYPAQLVTTVYYKPGQDFDCAAAEETLAAAVTRQGLGVTELTSYNLKTLQMYRSGSSFSNSESALGTGYSECTLVVMSAGDYNKLYGGSVELKKDQAMLAGAKADSDTISLNFSKNGKGEVKGREYSLIQGDENFALGDFMVYARTTRYLILPDIESVVELTALASESGNDSGAVSWSCLIDTDGSPEQQIACYKKLCDVDYVGIGSLNGFEWERYNAESREANSEDFYSTNGGFFFLGIFLGFIFIMAMVLIMYYKQISEGYEDRARFTIMRQVGLPKSEIRRSINVQVLVVFFAPLVVAGIHVFFDFNLVRILLTLFGMVNAKLAALCTLATFGVFALLYAAVYALTAKTYYGIVSNADGD